MTPLAVQGALATLHPEMETLDRLQLHALGKYQVMCTLRLLEHVASD